jgi:kumamolisin
MATIKLAGSAKHAPKGAQPAGAVPDHERVGVTIRVRRKPGAGQPKLRAKPLTREQFRAKYGASPADIQKIEDFANAHGLDVVRTSVSERAVWLSGTAAAMQAAFGVTLQQYCSNKDSEKGNLFRCRTGSISVPKELSAIIEGVFGLDNRPQAEAHFRIAPGFANKAKSGFKPNAAAGKPLTPVQVAKLYNFPASVTGKGQCIAILELGGGFTTPDLTYFFKSLGIRKPAVTAVSVLGAHNDPTGPGKDANGEVMLDIEVAGAVAPGAKIAVYFAPNTDEGFLGALNAAIHDSVRKPSVISISWGQAESGWTTQAKQDFDSACSDAAVMGVTVCVAAGDHGAADSDDPSVSDANVDFPASSPNVLACGGTRLTGTTANKIASETVWNSNDGWATGGGVSSFFPLPAYQKSAGVPKSLNGGKPGRGVPDICGNADSDTGYLIRLDGQTVPIGGTSAVAPLWAGLIALLNEGTKKSQGPIAKKLYALKAAASALHDITSGNNSVGSVQGYAAKPGWDACTGLGSPNGANLLTALRKVP